MIDFAVPDAVAERAARVRAFVERHCEPLEARAATGDLPESELLALREVARLDGLLVPQAGLDHRGTAIVLEAAGRSVLGPIALNCAAPDEGNMALLDRLATPAQRERYLAPLLEGRIRSCFCMTEPDGGAGSDPSMLRTTATPHGDGWRIDGRKWLITGADGAAFAIVLARSAERIDGRRGATMLLVDAGTPGMRVVRRVPTLDAAAPGGHCEVVFDGCVVPADALLGEADRGLEHAQLRLAPARLTHCMRWLGLAQRCHEIAVAYACERESFGATLGEHQMVQAKLADSELDLSAARLMTWRACWELDAGEGSGRHVSSLAKVFVSEAVMRSIDRSLQLCGGLGASHDLPLARAYADARLFSIYDGANDVHRMAIARRLLRAGHGAG